MCRVDQSDDSSSWLLPPLITQLTTETPLVSRSALVKCSWTRESEVSGVRPSTHPRASPPGWALLIDGIFPCQCPALKRVSGHGFLPAEHFTSRHYFSRTWRCFWIHAGLLWHVIQLPECDFRHLFWIPVTLWKMLVLKGSKRKSKFSSFCMKYQSLYGQNHWNRKRIWLCPISGISRAQGQRDSSASCGFGPDYCLKVTVAATKPRQIYISRHNLF